MISTLNRLSDCTMKIAFCPGDAGFVTGTTDRVVTMWDQANNLVWERDLKSILEKDRSSERIRGIAFYPDSRQIFISCGTTIFCLDWATGRIGWTWDPPRALCFLVSSPQEVLWIPFAGVVTTTDSALLVRLDTHGHVIRKQSHNDAPKQMAYWPQMNVIVGTDGFSYTVWDPETFHQKYRVRLFEPVHAFALDAKVGRVAVRTLHTVRIMDAASAATQYVIPTQPGLPIMDFSKSTGDLAIGHETGVTVVNPAGKVKREMECPAKLISFKYSDLGDRLVMGLGDGTVTSVLV